MTNISINGCGLSTCSSITAWCQMFTDSESDFSNTIDFKKCIFLLKIILTKLFFFWPCLLKCVWERLCRLASELELSIHSRLIHFSGSLRSHLPCFVPPSVFVSCFPFLSLFQPFLLPFQRLTHFDTRTQLNGLTYLMSAAILFKDWGCWCPRHKASISSVSWSTYCRHGNLRFIV